jgi:hypothetical protein
LSAFGINVLSLLLVAIYDFSVDLRRIRLMFPAEIRFLPCVLSMAIYMSKHFSRQKSKPPEVQLP